MWPTWHRSYFGTVFRCAVVLLSVLFHRLVQGNPHRLLTTMRPDDNWEAEQSKLDAAFQSQFLSKVTPEEKEQWITKSELHSQQLSTLLSLRGTSALDANDTTQCF